MLQFQSVKITVQRYQVGCGAVRVTSGAELAAARDWRSGVNRAKWAFALRRVDVTGSTAAEAMVDGRLAVEKSCMDSSSAFLLNNMCLLPWMAWIVTKPTSRKRPISRRTLPKLG